MERTNHGDVVIAHPMDSFHPASGGGIRYLMNLLRESVSQGWSVKVVGVRAQAPPSDAGWTQVSISRQAADWIDWVGYLLSLYLRLPYLRLPRKAVIVTHRMDCMLAFVLFKSNHPKVMVSATPAHYLRISFPRLFALFGWLYRLAERVCVYGCDAVVPVDPVTRLYYTQRYPGRRITQCVPSAVDLRRTSIPSRSNAREALKLATEAKVVLFVGRLAPVKNVPLLLRGFARVAHQVPEAQLWIVGHGESEAELKSLASQCRGRTVFVGEVPPDQIAPYYAAADVLALCSLEEGSPTVVKEALACGTPVVSTDVGDVSEVLAASFELGRTVAASEETLAEAIVCYLTRPPDDAAVRLLRCQAVQRYDVQETARRLIEICEWAQALKAMTSSTDWRSPKR